MSFLKKIEEIPKEDGQIRIKGILKQFGPGGAILNASIDGEQKTTINFLDEEVPKISTECLSNGVFKHRIKNIPTALFDKESKEYSSESVRETFEAIKFNRVEFRGGAIMSDSGTMNSEKSLRIDESVPLNNNKEFFTVENRRLGIKGDGSGNDYPRQQILYKNLIMFFSCFFDLKAFHPQNNKIIKVFLNKVDHLKENKESELLKKEINQWFEKTYPLDSNGKLDVTKIVDSLMKEIKSYEHPVHKRYNSFLIMTEVSFEKINSIEDLIESLSKTKKHHGII